MKAQIAGVATIILIAVLYGLVAAWVGMSFLVNAFVAVMLMVTGAVIAGGVFDAMRGIDRQRLHRLQIQQTGGAVGFDDWLAEQDRLHGL